MKTILVDAVDTFIIEGEGVFEEMHNLLDKYPNKKIILTNANDEQMKIFGLVNLPYTLFTLKHKPDKTDPNYFKIMLKHFKLGPKEVIYFEHNNEAVKSAQSLGITAFHYNANKKDLVSLKKFIDANL
jgi:HAD superfamily hydrolase (TIGR01509 family)